VFPIDNDATTTTTTTTVYGAGKDNEGRGTDSPVEHHPNQTNGAPPPQPPKFITGQMYFLPPNQQRQSN